MREIISEKWNGDSTSYCTIFWFRDKDLKPCEEPKIYHKCRLRTIYGGE